jgi:arsenate reductase
MSNQKPDVITLYFNSNSARAKQTLVYAKTENLPIHDIDILKTTLPGTKIVELAQGLGIEVSELVNQEHPSYAYKYEHHTFSTDDWIKMIQHNPEIMRQPIAIKGDVTMMISSPRDLEKL